MGRSSKAICIGNGELQFAWIHPSITHQWRLAMPMSASASNTRASLQFCIAFRVGSYCSSWLLKDIALAILVSMLHCMRREGRIGMLVCIVVSTAVLVILILLASILIVLISVDANARAGSEIMFGHTSDVIRIIVKLSHKFLALTVRGRLGGRSLKSFLKEVVIHVTVLRREVDRHHL